MKLLYIVWLKSLLKEFRIRDIESKVFSVIQNFLHTQPDVALVDEIYKLVYFFH